MDSLFEQFATITKAHAFDILEDQVKELKAILAELIRIGELDEIVFINESDTYIFQKLVEKAKILSL